MKIESEMGPNANKRCRLAPQLKADSITAARGSEATLSVARRPAKNCSVNQVVPCGEVEGGGLPKGPPLGRGASCGGPDAKVEDMVGEVSPRMFSSQEHPQ